MSTEVKVAVIPDCDICKSRPAAYDGRMKPGRPWAYMCEECWQEHGIGVLGTGYGQRLILDDSTG